ncbi:hypothetical protein MGG_15447 [Pyricularia oryzae 70-15]|uniref:Uncharacterized protein n=3 Tax=Pyricularia oryzae TaxID=318829 RepID=G5EH44_PYRO7|nr:uncharacterized protein MGG_15447 [Pyricularia oryzae 70-15]EAQ71680.1 hypothetical protein MGCH7_ch7g1087 [Pyricularia oryzae 70-15]EHA45771.1 hypothetical protein MGG_15447 [Pyricularia oryzae 70-15]ELQ42368.1 hypothetical protein OOU_Y34scaffold00213g4 [Pyricularia oryzae Y34]
MLPTSREAPLCDAIFHVENAHSIQALGSTPTSSSPYVWSQIRSAATTASHGQVRNAIMSHLLSTIFGKVKSRYNWTVVAWYSFSRPADLDQAGTSHLRCWKLAVWADNKFSLHCCSRSPWAYREGECMIPIGAHSFTEQNSGACGS